jgi:hypothetical protein
VQALQRWPSSRLAPGSLPHKNYQSFCFATSIVRPETLAQGYRPTWFSPELALRELERAKLYTFQKIADFNQGLMTIHLPVVFVPLDTQPSWP